MKADPPAPSKGATMNTRHLARAAAIGGITVAATAVSATAALGIKYRKQLKTLRTLTRESSYLDGFDLYTVDIAYDYDLDAIIDTGVRDDQAYIDAVVSQVLPGLPVHVEAPAFACSACRVTTSSGVLTGRNYDFKDDTSALLVRCHPAGGYASIGFAALNNLGDNAPLDTLTGRTAALMGPFAQLDGINERGVSIAVLTLDSAPCDQNTGRPVANTSLAIRLVLDRAATTQEAVDLLSTYDMHAMAGRDYHFFINDATGDARVVEWDPRDPSRTITVTPARQITNYYALYENEVQPNQKNGELGHGRERALAIAEILDRAGDAADEGTAWEALRAAAQEPNPADITSNTQWSVVFDNTDLTATVTLRRHWGDTFRFEL